MHNNNRFRIRRKGGQTTYAISLHLSEVVDVDTYLFNRCLVLLTLTAFTFFYVFNSFLNTLFPLCDTELSKCVPNTKKIEAEIRYDTAKEFASDIRFGHVFRLFWNWTCPHNHIKLNGTRKAHLGDGFCFCIVVPFPFVIFSFNCVCLRRK